MVQIQGFPGVEVVMLEQGVPKHEYPVPSHITIPHSQHLNYPRKDVLIAVRTGEPIRIRMSISAALRQLLTPSEPHGFHVYSFINGQRICRSGQRIDKMRDHLITKGRSSFDYNVDAVVRQRQYQKKALGMEYVLRVEHGGTGGSGTNSDDAEDNNKVSKRAKPKSKAKKRKLRKEVSTICVKVFRYNDLWTQVRQPQDPGPNAGSRRRRSSPPARDNGPLGDNDEQEARRQKCPHSVAFTEGEWIGQSDTRKVRTTAERRNGRGPQPGDLKWQRGKRYLDGHRSGKRFMKEPCFAVYFHYRSPEMLRELDIDMSDDDDDHGNGLCLSDRSPSEDDHRSTGRRSKRDGCPNCRCIQCRRAHRRAHRRRSAQRAQSEMSVLDLGDIAARASNQPDYSAPIPVDADLDDALRGIEDYGLPDIDFDAEYPSPPRIEQGSSEDAYMSGALNGQVRPVSNDSADHPGQSNKSADQPVQSVEQPMEGVEQQDQANDETVQTQAQEENAGVERAMQAEQAEPDALPSPEHANDDDIVMVERPEQDVISLGDEEEGANAGAGTDAGPETGAEAGAKNSANTGAANADEEMGEGLDLVDADGE